MTRYSYYIEINEADIPAIAVKHCYLLSPAVMKVNVPWSVTPKMKSVQGCCVF